MGGFDNSFDFSKFDLSKLPAGDADSTVPEKKEKGHKQENKEKKKQSYHKSETGTKTANDAAGQKNGNAVNMSVFAPYNFVSLPEKTVFLDSEIPTGHNSVPEPEKELLSGEIQYKIHAETPIFIDDGNDHFYKNGDGKFAIPGSSVRGMIRSNAQILSFSSIADDVDDYALMYRDVANGLNKERYGNILGSKAIPVEKKNKDGKKIVITVTVLENVRAGYICNENGKYVIYGTENDKADPVTGKIDLKKGKRNYYYISERTIIENYLNGEKEGKAGDFDYLFSDGKSSILQHEPEYFVEGVKKIGGKSTRIYMGTQNLKYMPSYFPVCYTLKGKGTISSITGPEKKEESDSIKSGVYISSGYMQLKKMVYVIPEVKKDILVADLSKDHEKELREFQIDYNRRKNSITLERKHKDRKDEKKIQEYKDFFNLPREGECKPVFYIMEGGRLYFGFTPRLRLYYDHTVKRGLRANDGGTALDYAKSIFGYTYDSSSYKSRVSFSDAVVEGVAEVLKDRYVTLSEPRPTDYLSYLKQSDGKTTYNSSNFEIRGIKQYWLHNEADPGKRPGTENKNIDSCLRPLKQGACFKGTVRFHNLKPAELGLLLWSIRLEEGYCMNIGQAKPYGYGRIKFSDLKLRVFDFSKAYALTGELDTDPFDDSKEMQLYIDAFIQDMGREERSGIADIRKQRSIRELLMMKNGKQMPLKSLTGYMDLEGYTAQKRNSEVLPSVEKVYKAKGKK